MHPLTPRRPVAAPPIEPLLLAAFVTLAGCIDNTPPTVDPAESSSCLDGRAGVLIGPAGGAVCVGGHTLHVPPGAFTVPSNVQLHVDDPPPLGDAPPFDGVEGTRTLATARISFPRSPRRPLLWVAPINPPDATRHRSGDLLIPLRFTDRWRRSTHSAADAPTRHLPGLTDDTGALGAALVLAPGWHALAEPADEVHDAIEGPQGLRCHPLDAHVDPTVDRAPPVALLYDAPLVTRPLVDLLQSARRGPGELALALPPGRSTLAALADALTESLDDQLCVGDLPPGASPAALEQAVLLGAADRIGALGGDCTADRSAALVIAAWALWLEAHRVLADAHEVPVDAQGVDPRPPSSTRAVETALMAACAANGISLASIDAPWDLPPGYALAIARIAEVPAETLAAADDSSPLDPCRWRSLVGAGVPSRSDGEDPVGTDTALSLLAERAWLDHLITIVEREGAFVTPDADAATLDLLDDAMNNQASLLTALFRLMQRHGVSSGGNFDARRRRDFIDSLRIELLTPRSGCVTPPSVPAGAPDPCAPRLDAPADGATVPANAGLRWQWPPRRCHGDDEPEFLVACAEHLVDLHALNGSAPFDPQSADRQTSAAFDPRCTEPGRWWWWRVALVDRVTDMPRWSDARRYRIEEQPEDPCAGLGAECALDLIGAPVDCRPPASAPPCDRCDRGRCAPRDEVEAAAIQSPLADPQMGAAGGLQVPLPCRPGEAVHAPVAGELTVVVGDRLCVDGGALTVCLTGVVPGPDLRRGCRVDAGAPLGTCDRDELVVEAQDPDDGRRPLPPPARWQPHQLAPPPCCPAAEACNGADDDCDGVTDELYADAIAVPRCVEWCADEAGDPIMRRGALACVGGHESCRLDVPCPPVNDRCAGATRWAEVDDYEPAPLPDRAGDTTDASDAHPGCGARAGGDVYYELVLHQRAALWIDVDGPGASTVSLYPAAAACDALPQGRLACGARIEGQVVEAGTYRLVVDAVGAEGPFTLRGHWEPRCVPGERMADRMGMGACLQCNGAGNAVEPCPPEPEPEPEPEPIGNGMDDEINPCDPPGRCDDIPPGEVIPEPCPRGLERVDDVCQPLSQCKFLGESIERIYPPRVGLGPDGPRDFEDYIVIALSAGRLSGGADVALSSTDVEPRCPEPPDAPSDEYNEAVCEQVVEVSPTWECSRFPLLMMKRNGAAPPVFDPSERNDRSCLDDANDCNFLQIREIDYSLRVSNVQGGSGQTVPGENGRDDVTFSIDQIGVCAKPIVVDLTPYLGMDPAQGGDPCAPIYLHVVRDACPDDPAVVNYWYSNVLAIGRDCPQP